MLISKALFEASQREFKSSTPKVSRLTPHWFTFTFAYIKLSLYKSWILTSPFTWPKSCNLLSKRILLNSVKLKSWNSKERTSRGLSVTRPHKRKRCSPRLISKLFTKMSLSSFKIMERATCHVLSAMTNVLGWINTWVKWRSPYFNKRKLAENDPL